HRISSDFYTKCAGGHHNHAAEHEAYDLLEHLCQRLGQIEARPLQFNKSDRRREIVLMTKYWHDYMHHNELCDSEFEHAPSRRRGAKKLKPANNEQSSPMFIIEGSIQEDMSLRKCFDQDQENFMLVIIMIAFSLIGLIGLTIENRCILVVYSISVCLIMVASLIIYSASSSSTLTPSALLTKSSSVHRKHKTSSDINVAKQLSTSSVITTKFNNLSTITNTMNDSINNEDSEKDINESLARTNAAVKYQRDSRRMQSITSQTIDLILHSIAAFCFALLVDDETDKFFVKTHSQDAAPVYNYNGVRYSIKSDHHDNNELRSPLSPLPQFIVAAHCAKLKFQLAPQFWIDHLTAQPSSTTRDVIHRLIRSPTEYGKSLGIWPKLVLEDSFDDARRVGLRIGIIRRDHHRLAVIKSVDLLKNITDSNGNIKQSKVCHLLSRMRIMAQSTPADKSFLVYLIKKCKPDDNLAYLGYSFTDPEVMKLSDCALTFADCDDDDVKREAHVMLQSPNNSFGDVYLFLVASHLMSNVAQSYALFQISMSISCCLYRFLSIIVFQGDLLGRSEFLVLTLIQCFFALVCIMTKWIASLPIAPSNIRTELLSTTTIDTNPGDNIGYEDTSDIKSRASRTLAHDPTFQPIDLDKTIINGRSVFDRPQIFHHSKFIDDITYRVVKLHVVYHIIVMLLVMVFGALIAPMTGQQQQREQTTSSQQQQSHKRHGHHRHKHRQDSNKDNKDPQKRDKRHSRISIPADLTCIDRTPVNAVATPSSSMEKFKTTGASITNILNKILHEGYDKRVRPNYGGPPVEVNVTMRILSISSVSEVMMDFTADFYFRQTWVDPRLSFERLGDIRTLYVGAEVSRKIWLPDTFFGNEKLAYFHEATTPNVFLRIDHSGEVYRSIRLTVTSSCPMKLQYFPMDRQECTIEAESYGYNVRDIKYRWARRDTAVERDETISLPQFDIIKTEQKSRMEQLSSGTYSRLIAKIHFARRMGYYLIQIYIPSSLIVVISWVSFWLHRNASPARVQLGVTTVLTMTTLMSSTNAALPKISYVKSIDVFLGTCFVMVFAALLEYATVGYLGKRIAMRKAHAQNAQQAAFKLHQQQQQLQQQQQAQLQQQQFSNYPMGEHSVTKTNTSKGMGLLSSLMKGHQQPTATTTMSSSQAALVSRSVAKFSGKKLDSIFGVRPSDIDKYSRVVFPVCFICFQLMYWIVYLHISAFLETSEADEAKS
ncbi:Gamma-aminobutyric acid receptor subunit beta, partial [Fragariocoptes setiger]